MDGFDKIFKHREFNQLVGVGYRDFYVLVLILFVTFFALAHIFGGQNELEERMSNPFTNWVNLPVSNITGKNMPKLVEQLENQELLDSFDITGAKYYQINWLKGLTKSLKATKKIRLRSIEFDDPIMNAVTSKSNILHTTKDSLSPCHILITKEALQNLEYYHYQDTMYLPVYDNEYDDYKLILLFPIAYVVKELPNNVDVVVSSTLMSLLNSKIEDTNFFDQSKSRYFSFFSKEKIEKNQLAKFLEGSAEIANIGIERFELNGQTFLKHIVKLYSNLSFVDALILKNSMASLNIYSYVDFNCNSAIRENIHDHYYALNFSNLSKIKDFRDFAKNDFDVNISLAQIESKENFYLISWLAQMFIYLLIIFSLFSIIVFLQNIIRNHLEKVKPILGTLKAFGFKDEKIRTLYMSVLYKFFGLASLVAFLLLIIYYILLQILEVNVFFDLFNLKIVLIWVALAVIQILFFYRFIANILFKSPGDLIYNR